MVTINMPAFAAALGAAKGAGFDTDNILEQVIGVFLGTTDAKAIPAQLIEEIADVVRNYSKDPVGTSVDTAVGAAIPTGLLYAVGMALDAFGLPTRKTFGGVTIIWAIKPAKKRRSKKKKTRRRSTRKPKVVYRYRRKKGGK